MDWLIIHSKLKLALLVVTLLVCLSCNRAADAISINQDGFGSSGAVVGFPLGTDIKIQGYGDFGTFGKGENFYSAVFDGKDIWNVGTRSNLSRFDRVTGTNVVYKYNNPSNSNMGNVNTVSGEIFCGGVFDGTYLWLVPRNADSIVRVDPATGIMNGYSLSTGTNMGTAQGAQDSKFDGATFDGNNIWIAPFHSDRVVKFDVTTHQFTGYGLPVGGSFKFVGAIVSPGAVWLAPYNANLVIKVNIDDGTMTTYSMKESINENSNMGNLGLANPVDNAFQGGGFDGKYVWLTPSKADRVVRIDPSSGTMTGFKPEFPDFPSYTGSLFSGAAFDGRNLWLCPDQPHFETAGNESMLIKFDTQMNAFTGYLMRENGTTRINTGNYGIATSGHGAVFDGENIWMAPYNSNRMMKISPTSYTYHVEYYQGTLAPENLIKDVIGQTHFSEGTVLTYENVETDLGIDWENAYQPRFYQSGEIQGYPTISVDQTKNVVKVLYEPAQLLHSYTVKYYANYPHGDELIARERSPLVYTTGSLIDMETIEDDFGADWVNKYKPVSNFEEGIVETAMPMNVSSDPRENEIKVVYSQIEREPVYGFRVDYYKDDLDPASKITTAYPSVAVGLYAGTQLTKEIVDSVYISDWKNYFKPAGYNNGMVKTYPIISPDPENNVVKVLYEEPKYAYHVQYFTGSLDDPPIEVLNGEDHLLGTQVTEGMVSAELGEGWINRFKPQLGTQSGQVQDYFGSLNGYPKITADEFGNNITVLYPAELSPIVPGEKPEIPEITTPGYFPPKTSDISSIKWTILFILSVRLLVTIRKIRR